jgi:mannose-1-phosphate guanylyltransferase
VAKPEERDLHVMLLAGGSGTRFWPSSRASRPKQLLPLAGKRPLLVETWQRVRKIAPPSRLWVIAPRPLVPAIRALLPQLREDQIVVEPSPRDTAPAIALACETLERRHPRAVAAIFPTDHVIRDPAAFERAVATAAGCAREGHLVCLGVLPDHPATGFGYLQCDGERGSRRRPQPMKVRRFVEKPDAPRARRFVRSGRYLWNAGMFVWRAARFLEELDRTAPAIRRAVRSLLDWNPRAWGRATRLSFDYAVMEQARGVRVVPLDAGWDDVGSWEAAARLLAERGLSDSRHILVDSPGSSVFGGERLVAVVGVPDATVVDTGDALLVVSHKRAQQVRRVVDELKRRRRRDLL